MVLNSGIITFYDWILFFDVFRKGEQIEDGRIF